MTVSETTHAMRLYDASGARLYVTAEERARFLAAAETTADRATRTLCMTLAWSGCRISEALQLTADRVDLSASVLVIGALKQRRAGVWRAVPVPALLLDALDLVHGVREAQVRTDLGRGLRLWPVSRATASRRIAEVMEAAQITGPQASAKGLRHGFGVNAVTRGVALNMVQKWMGHAQLTTTAIYANASGAEEQDIAARMWA